MAVCEPLILTEFRKPALHPICNGRMGRKKDRGKQMSINSHNCVSQSANRSALPPAFPPSLPSYQGPSRKGQLRGSMITSLVQHPGFIRETHPSLPPSLPQFLTKAPPGKVSFGIAWYPPSFSTRAP